jgi:hypothetical protein
MKIIFSFLICFSFQISFSQKLDINSLEKLLNASVHAADTLLKKSHFSLSDKEIAKGYTGKTEPFHGYYFRVLKGQGPAARLGVLDYVIDDAMIGGFALVAFPSQYKITGVMTFMVSQDGVVYEKDLGPKSLDLGLTMERFNPDKTWTVTDVDFED